VTVVVVVVVVVTYATGGPSLAEVASKLAVYGCGIRFCRLS
jgi:hypothetical protein